MTTTTAPVITNRFNSRTRTYRTSFTYNGGYRVNVSTTHNKENKTYSSLISLVSYEDTGTGFTVEKSIGSIFSDNFAYRFVSAESIARYSQPSLQLTHENHLQQFKLEQQNKYEAKIHSLLNGSNEE